MKRIIGIILIIVGVGFAAMALSRHEDDKTLIDLGKIEIKDENHSPSKNTTLYYVIAAICVVGGAIMISGRKVE